MKTRLLILICIFAYQTILAQTTTGIAVQGIARDAEKAALVDELLTFTFDIQNPDGKSHYKEEEEIRTDPFGVFSHIIGTSSNRTGVFNEIPFGQAHMKLIISVKDEVISNSPFQYTPYAKSAENGVPTGTIVAYAGTEANIPKGWTLCDGRDLAGVKDAANLIELIGDNAPDLRGMFLRGAGKNNDIAYDENNGPALNTFQADAFETHNIDATTNSDGSHAHEIKVDSGGGDEIKGWRENMIKSETNGTSGWVNFSSYTEPGGAHTHVITGMSEGGAEETRPVNYGVNYIIKL